MEILFFIIFFNLIENGFARRIQGLKGLKGFNRLNHSRRKDRKVHDTELTKRSKRQLELHIWKTVVAARTNMQKMEELQNLAKEVMKNPPPASVSSNYIKRHNGRRILPGTRMRIKGGHRRTKSNNLLVNDMQR